MSHFTKQQVTYSIAALILTIACSLVVDQATKIVAEDNLKLWSHETDLRQYQGQRYPLATLGEPEAGKSISLSMNYVRNLGAAWGMFSSLDDTYRVPFFYVVTLIAIIMLIYTFWQTPVEHRVARYGLAMIISGAFGNCLDRIRIGYVIDFIDVRWKLEIFSLSLSYNFPNFNIADSCITLGVGLIFFDAIVLNRQRENEAKGEEGDPSASKVPT